MLENNKYSIFILYLLSINILKTYSVILFYGAVWGLIEATFGYINHHFHLHMANLILFPIGLACMVYASGRLNFHSYIPLAVAFVATLIKLTSLAFPIGDHLFRIINPCINMMGEGTFILVAILIFKIEDYTITLRGTGLLYIFAILFSMLFMCYQIAIGTRELNYLLSPTHLAIKFSQISYHILLLLIFLPLTNRLYRKTKYRGKTSLTEKQLAIPTLLLAIIATILLR